MSQEPAHVAKTGIKDIPFFGDIAAAIGSLFVDRNDKNSKKTTIDLIIER